MLLTLPLKMVVSTYTSRRERNNTVWKQVTNRSDFSKFHDPIRILFWFVIRKIIKVDLSCKQGTPCQILLISKKFILFSCIICLLIYIFNLFWDFVLWIQLQSMGLSFRATVIRKRHHSGMHRLQVIWFISSDIILLRFVCVQRCLYLIFIRKVVTFYFLLRSLVVPNALLTLSILNYITAIGMCDAA